MKFNTLMQNKKSIKLYKSPGGRIAYLEVRVYPKEGFLDLPPLKIVRIKIVHINVLPYGDFH